MSTALNARQMEIMVFVCAALNYRDSAYPQYICQAVKDAACDLDACVWYGFLRPYRSQVNSILRMIDQALDCRTLERWLAGKVSFNGFPADQLGLFNQCRAGWLETIIARGRIE
ncbi:hypothetical protein BcepSauron_346 [Burkholderia phage BcepSauron]|uniref:Uncharacterized protein n=1 Tax=Burkholderia phage BcepSauron TaxID=2530033 RepID=A0A482MMH1_9CAUD|nr:hypothetical protein H1O17_gp346 [Burkholderia phage BcepSauron]QBQ74726.1 hypothetical protein BcepSauron_346 [Burkholderia phage BcepSauron]